MRCVLFDLLECERLSKSHEKLNISVLYSAIIELAILTERCFTLFCRLVGLEGDNLMCVCVCSKKYNNNEVFIDLHIEFCLKKLNINDPSYALIQSGAQGRHL